MEKWLTYDQVSLIPTVVSSLASRAEADTSIQFGPIKLSLPLIAAPMPDVSNGNMARKLAALGSFGWIHRFQKPKEQQLQYFLDCAGVYTTPIGVALPLLLDEEREEFVDAVMSGLGCKIVCLDTANGANVMVKTTIKTLKVRYPKIFIVAGNVASWETFRQLEDWGADAIRVGIAGGSVCETRTETGVYSPMASIILECTERGHKTMYGPKEKEPNHALLIADGGIKSPADMCKALALGADLVMVGGVFGGTKESPGEILKIDGNLFKILRGAASYSVQKGNSGYVEGAETIVPYQGSVEKVINRFAAGLRSSMSYMNSKTLIEYRNNVRVIEVDRTHGSS